MNLKLMAGSRHVRTVRAVCSMYLTVNTYMNLKLMAGSRHVRTVRAVCPSSAPTRASARQGGPEVTAHTM